MIDQIYQTLTIPQLEYVSSAWSPCLGQDILELEKVQRCVAHFGHNFDINNLYSRLGDTGAMPCLNMLFKAINSVTRFLMNCYKPSTATSTRSFHNLNLLLPSVELTYTSIPSFPRQFTVGTTCPDEPSCHL